MKKLHILLLISAISICSGTLNAAADIPKDAKQHLKAGIEIIQKAQSVDDYDHAVKEFEQVIALAPNFPDGYYYLGETLASTKGKVSRAIKNLNRYLELTPSGASDRAEISEEVAKLKIIRDKARRTELNGLELVHLSDGIYVRNVLEGSSFLGMRLRKGDKIVAVAGQSIEGMDMAQFYDLIYAAKEELKSERRLRSGPTFAVSVIHAGYKDKNSAKSDEVYLNKETFFSELYDIDEEEYDGAIKNEKIALTVFWKHECTECLKAVPEVERVAVARKIQLKAYSVNATENPELIQNLKIEKIPAVLVYLDGKISAKWEGAETYQELDTKLNSLIGTPQPQTVKQTIGR